MAWLIALLLPFAWPGTSQAEPLPAPAMCPTPREILLVRCPGRDEIAGPVMTCRQKIRIDECAQATQGEGK